MGKAGTAASSGEAGIKAATEAASAQPGKQLTGGSATAAAQGVHSDYSFPAHTEPAENPSVRFVRAAATASRLASAPAAQKESEEAADEVPESMAGPRKGAGRGKTAAEKRYKSKAAAPQVSKKRESRAAGKAMEAEGDPGLEQPNEAAEEMPRKAARQGRKTAKTDQPEPEGAPVPARPIRGRTTPAAAEEDAVNEANATTAAEPDQDAEKADVQEEMGTEDPPKSVSAGPAKGKKIPAPAGESKAGEKGKGGAGKGKEAARTDATAEMEVPQARYRLSRTTRAAQTTAESSGQADAGTATAPQQAKRSKVNVRVAAPEGLVKGAESEVADASAKRSAGLTESQAAADTLAKVIPCFAQDCV